jgi:hypothetical protein
LRLPGRWVKAEPAAERAALLEPSRLRALDAAEEALKDVVFIVPRCESEEPEADFADLLELLSRKTLDADEAARLLVTSDLVTGSVRVIP